MRDAPPLRRAERLGFDVELRAIRTNGRRWPPHWHADLQLIATVEGCGQAWVDGETYDLPRGALVMIPSGAVHTAEGAGGDAAWTFLSLHVAPERVSGLAGRTRLLAVAASHPTARTFHRIVDALFAGPSERLMGAWRGLLDGLRAGATEPPAFAAPALMIEARRRLEDVADAGVSVGSLSADLGLQRRTFERSFRTAFHLPPHTWRRIARVEAAKAAMRDGLPLAQAAQVAGYADLRHFSRQYRQLTGITARAFAARFHGNHPAG